jgi:hypothetical protein
MPTSAGGQTAAGGTGSGTSGNSGATPLAAPKIVVPAAPFGLEGASDHS